MLFFKYVLYFVKNNNYLELSTPNNIFLQKTSVADKQHRFQNNTENYHSRTHINPYRYQNEKCGRKDQLFYYNFVLQWQR